MPIMQLLANAQDDAFLALFIIIGLLIVGAALVVAAGKIEPQDTQPP